MPYGRSQDWTRTRGESIVKTHLKDYGLKARKIASLGQGAVISRPGSLGALCIGPIDWKTPLSQSLFLQVMEPNRRGR